VRICAFAARRKYVLITLSSVVHDGRAVRNRPESISKHLATSEELYPRSPFLANFRMAADSLTGVRSYVLKNLK